MWTRHRRKPGSRIAGLIALVAGEAALSLTPGATLSSMALRFLRPVRVGPAVATAQVRAGLGRVEVRDAGGDDRRAVIVTTRAGGGHGTAGAAADPAHAV